MTFSDNQIYEIGNPLEEYNPRIVFGGIPIICTSDLHRLVRAFILSRLGILPVRILIVVTSGALSP